MYLYLLRPLSSVFWNHVLFENLAHGLIVVLIPILCLQCAVWFASDIYSRLLFYIGGSAHGSNGLGRPSLVHKVHLGFMRPVLSRKMRLKIYAPTGPRTPRSAPIEDEDPAIVIGQNPTCGVGAVREAEPLQTSIGILI